MARCKGFLLSFNSDLISHCCPIFFPSNLVGFISIKTLVVLSFGKPGVWEFVVTTQTIIIFYIADTLVTRLRLLTNVSDNIAVPFASLRSLILLFNLAGLTFTRSARGMLDSVSHNKILFTYNLS